MVEKGEFLVSVLKRYYRILESFRDRIDRLNVFPVPDGDTGTNMFFTVRSAIESLSNLDFESLVTVDADQAKAISKGALLGARGNSGVILSQVIASFATTFGSNDPTGEVKAVDVANFLAAANERARAAVLRPVEGTILTVLRDVASVGLQSTSLEISAFTDVIFDEAQRSLDETPKYLEALARADVVDSGGAGFVLFVAAMAFVIKSTKFTWGTEVPFNFEAKVPTSLIPREVDEEQLAEDGPRYEVMFILTAQSPSLVDNFRELWASLGDSIVIVGQDDTYNCHIHTDDIGASIEAGIQSGQVSKIRVTDLHEQVREERWVLESKGVGAPDLYGVEVKEVPKTSVVAVANGDGVRRIFRSLGVHRIVQGGQSMNPSTDEILKAIDEAPSNDVIVLPNNSNVTAVAQIAAEVSIKNVRVIPTRGVVEGMSALVSFDPMVAIDENYDAMAEGAKRVVVAEITRAVRDYQDAIGRIKSGEYIGITTDGIVSVSHDLTEVVIDTIGKLLTDDSEIVTVIEGEGSSAAISREISEWMALNFPDIEVEFHHGQQPSYPYLVGIE